MDNKVGTSCRPCLLVGRHLGRHCRLPTWIQRGESSHNNLWTNIWCSINWFKDGSLFSRISYWSIASWCYFQGPSSYSPVPMRQARTHVLLKPRGTDSSSIHCLHSCQLLKVKMREILSFQSYFSNFVRVPPLQKLIFHLQFLLKMLESSAECGRVGNYL